MSVIVPTRSLQNMSEVLASLEANAGRDVPFETIVVVNGHIDGLAEQLLTVGVWHSTPGIVREPRCGRRIQPGTDRRVR